MKIFKQCIGFLKNVKATAAQTGLTGLQKWLIMFDVIYCQIRFRCRCKEYCIYQFHRYKDNYRKNFLLYYHLHKHYGNDKNMDRSKYKKIEEVKLGFSRDIIVMPECGEETFLNFIRKHKKVVIKPDVGNGGEGVSVVEYTDEDSALALFRSITKKTLCEEYIYQHEEINRMNPYCLNTIRVVTLLSDGEFSVICATLKTGITVEAVTDNFHANGIGASIDLSTGVVNSYARGYREKYYIDHPITGEPIFGKKIPHWDKVYPLLCDAHKKIPDVPVVGWDIAIVPQGIEIVEVNMNPGPLLMQLMDGIPKGEKILMHMKKQNRSKKK